MIAITRFSKYPGDELVVAVTLEHGGLALRKKLGYREGLCGARNRTLSPNAPENMECRRCMSHTATWHGEISLCA